MVYFTTFAHSGTLCNGNKLQAKYQFVKVAAACCHYYGRQRQVGAGTGQRPTVRAFAWRGYGAGYYRSGGGIGHKIFDAVCFQYRKLGQTAG